MLSSAQTYLSSVQSALADKPEAYEAFLGIMSDFRDGRWVLFWSLFFSPGFGFSPSPFVA